VATCEETMGVYSYTATLRGCWNEWVAAAKCDATIEYTCPCNVADCILPNDVSGYDATKGYVPKGPCYAERTAYEDCKVALSAGYGWGTPIKGSRANVEWHETPTGCHAEGTDAKPDALYTAECDGAPGGPYRCNCLVNGRQPVDAALGVPVQFTARD